MAENLSPLELVPRGVEGTGKAVVLGNEPVVQSLARLSGRLDNLEKLKLYAQAKKAEAKAKEVKTEYDKFEPDIPGIASGYMTPIVESIIRPQANNFAKNFNQYDPEQKRFQAGILKENITSGNNIIANLESQLPKQGQTLFDLGFNLNPKDVDNSRNVYVNQMVEKAKADAQELGITDPKQIQELAHRNILTNPNAAIDAYRTVVTSNPNNINLNRFGKRILNNIDESGRSVKTADGIFQRVDYNNVRNNDGSLNYDLIKLAINADDVDANMLNLASTQYLSNAANAINKDDKDKPQAIAAVDELIKNNYDYNKLTEGQKQLITQKVMPIAQNGAIEAMFAGKGKFVSQADFETTEDKAKAEAEAFEKAGIKTGTFDITADNTVGTVIQGKYGPVPQTQNGTQFTVKIPNVRLGKADTKVLPGENRFTFNTGSRMYFLGHMPNAVKKLLARENADGSYNTLIPIKTSSASLLRQGNNVYATKGNPVMTDTKGKQWILPQGTIVNRGEYNSQEVLKGKRKFVIDIEEALKYIPDELRKDVERELRISKEPYTGARIIISADDNPQALTTFFGELKPITKQKSTGSTNYLGQ